MRRLFYLLLSVMTLSVVASCIDRPDCVLDEPQLVDVLVDVHRAEGLLEVQALDMDWKEKDNYQRDVIASVLAKHGVTRQQYDSSMMWYAQHLKLLTRVYSHVEDRLDEEHERWSLQVAEARDFAVSQPGDSVELWAMRNHLLLDRKLHQDMRFWEFASDTNFVAGDTLQWQFVIPAFAPGQRIVAQMSLNEPGLIGHTSQLIDTPGRYELRLQADSVQPFGTAILALVLIQDTTKMSPVVVDSISLVRLHPDTKSDTDE